MTTIEKIKAEIDGIEISGQIDINTSFVRTSEQVKNMALEIIDKYAEQEPTTRQSCETCIGKSRYVDGMDLCEDCEEYSNFKPKQTEETIDKYAEQEPCDKCEVGNPCLYCKHEFEQEPCDDAVEQLKKYTHGKKNTDKVEISVLALNRIIKALEQEPCDDAVSRQAALDVIVREQFKGDAISGIEKLPSVRPQEPKWIPMTTRPMTEEEKERHREQLEYVDDAAIFNCPLPDDGQEVFITVYGETELDTFYNDAIDGCYFENRDIEDVTAWMPKPKPYEPQESESDAE